MKKIFKCIGKNLHAVFFGFFTAHLGIHILSWTFFIGIFCLIAATMIRDHLNGVNIFGNEV